MIQLPIAPTDSLHKFKAIAGITLVIAGTVFFYAWLVKLDDLYSSGIPRYCVAQSEPHLQAIEAINNDTSLTPDEKKPLLKTQRAAVVAWANHSAKLVRDKSIRDMRISGWFLVGGAIALGFGIWGVVLARKGFLEWGKLQSIQDKLLEKQRDACGPNGSLQANWVAGGPGGSYSATWAFMEASIRG